MSKARIAAAEASRFAFSHHRQESCGITGSGPIAPPRHSCIISESQKSTAAINKIEQVHDIISRAWPELFKGYVLGGKLSTQSH